MGKWSSPRLSLLLCVGLSAVALPLLGAIGLDCYGKTRVAEGTYDAIVVAGCRVLEGGLPSPALERRVRLAVQLWREQRAHLIVLTGGVGTYPPSEAEAAALVARGLGVPSNALVIEAESTSTRENAVFARRLIAAKRILLVTDSYHVYRARWVFRQYFSEVDAVGSLAPASSRIAGAIREVGALGAYRLRALFQHGRA